MQDKRKDQILSSWNEPPVEAPQSHLAPSPPYAKEKEEEKRKARTRTSPIHRERRLDGVQLITSFRTLVKKER
jgi:hypothetical protein